MKGNSPRQAALLAAIKTLRMRPDGFDEPIHPSIMLHSAAKLQPHTATAPGGCIDDQTVSPCGCICRRCICIANGRSDHARAEHLQEAIATLRSELLDQVSFESGLLGFSGMRDADGSSCSWESWEDVQWTAPARGVTGCSGC